jgi:uncharacterized membrane protein HdeD (DUF308 family)
MAIRKRLRPEERRKALAYGVVSIVVALLVAQNATFEWSGALAFIIGLFGIGGVYRCIAGYDQL